MNRLKVIFSIFSFLIVLTTTAQSDIQRQGCRRGKLKAQNSGLLRSASVSQKRQAGGDFYTGELRQLAVLVSFGDLQFQGDETATIEKWNKIFNNENYDEKPYVGSLRDYFYAQSDGKMTITFDLQYVQLDSEHAKYASTDVDDENSQYLVNDIMDILEQRDIDWSVYDWSGDGFVNQLLIVFAGKGQNDGGGSTTIWAHQWWLSEHINPETKTYCDPRTVTNQSTGNQYLVDCYCALPEEGSLSTFGTLCHEYSHCFGLPDFYYGNTKYVGAWDLMDYGNYNGQGYCPPNYSAHERWLMGWLTPTELTEPSTISEMPAMSDDGSQGSRAYLIRNDGYDDEYYIIENRQKTGWDANLPGSGLVVFHIDFDADLWCGFSDFVNHPDYTIDGVFYPAKERYTIFHASNTQVTGDWTYPYGENNQLTNTSTPAATLLHENSDGTFYMNKSLTDMTVSDGLGSFIFGENFIHFPEFLNKVTFYHGTKNFKLPAGVTASVVTGLSDDGKLVCEKIVDETLRNGILHSGTAVILTREDTTLPTSISILETKEGEQYTGANLLHGSDEACSTDIYGTDYLFYKLALGHSKTEYEDVYSWYWGAANGGAFNIEAHKAWLALPQFNASSRLAMTDADQATSLREIGKGQVGIVSDIYYDMNGHRVLYPTKGIYILNGKKLVIR